jgi:hypothetical protein
VKSRPWFPDLPDYHATSKLARGTLGFAAPRWIDRLLSCRKRGEGATRFVDSGTQRANTSFNTRGEPIVNTSDDAVRGAEALGVDVLVVGDALFDRR